MRRTGNLWNKVIDKDNIKEAIINASKGKRNRKSVRNCLDDIDGTVDKIQKILIDGFKPRKAISKTIYDRNRKKERIIAYPKFFPDQIVHHALMQVIIPVIEPRMYYHSYGSIKGKGSHKAVRQVEKWLKTGKRMRYALVMDVKKFYEHCAPCVVEKALRKRIKDEKVITLCMAIVNGYDLGLPIGYYTSQWFANLVLTDLDFSIKDMGAEHYIRYMDDMLVLSKNKKRLHRIRKIVSEELSFLGMELKPNWQVFRIDSRDIDFLGYRINRQRTILRKSTFLRIRRRFSKASQRAPTAHDAMSLISYYGVISHSDLGGFFSDLTPKKKDLRRYLRVRKQQH